jgi:hypothetical protein
MLGVWLLWLLIVLLLLRLSINLRSSCSRILVLHLHALFHLVWRNILSVNDRMCVCSCSAMLLIGNYIDDQCGGEKHPEDMLGCKS